MQSELVHAMTPTTSLAQDETVQTSFTPDSATYWRDHAAMAAAAMGIGMAILWAMGNPHIWTGAVGGLAAVAVRAFYIASDELAARWDLTNRRLLGPGGRAVPLGQIKALNTLGSAVQIITTTGDKHLIKHQADPAATRARIEQTTRTQPKP